MTNSTNHNPSSRGPERRRHPRVQIAGLAILTGLNRLNSATCQIRNLSVGGAMLLDCPPMSAGERCYVTLVTPSLMSRSLKARVVRGGATAVNTHWAAVEFESPPIDMQQRLEKVVQTEVALATMPSVLVVDADEWKLAHIAEQLAQHARRALLAMNTADAIRLLENPEEQIVLAMVGTSVLGAAPHPFLDQIGQFRSDVHRATFEQPLSAQAMRRMLDMAESEVSSHPPWTLDDFV